MLEREATFDPQDFGIGRLFLHVSDAIIVANAGTERIVLWNHAAEKLFGYTRDEALALPLHTLVPDHLRDLHRRGIARYQETGSGLLLDSGSPVELSALRKGGDEVAIELTLTAVPERSEAGERFVLALIRDVSERKAAEAAQRIVDEASSDRRRAFELHDAIVQGLVTAKLALESGASEEGLFAVSKTLTKAQALVARLLGQIEMNEGPIEPGDLVVDPDPD